MLRLMVVACAAVVSSSALADKKPDERSVGVLEALSGREVTLSVNTTRGPHAKALTGKVESARWKIYRCVAGLPDFEAKVEFRITAEGKATGFKVANVKNKKVRPCLRTHLRAINFGKQAKSTQVTITAALKYQVPSGAFASLTGTGDFTTGPWGYGVAGAKGSELRNGKTVGPLSWLDVQKSFVDVYRRPVDPIHLVEGCRSSQGAKTFTVRFQILATGVASDVKIIGGTGDEQACLVRALMASKFNTAPRQTEVEFKVAVSASTTAGWGTIDQGRYGTIGIGDGEDAGYGSSPSRTAKPPQVRIGKASASNGLDKNLIRRYVRRKLPRIRLCYETELLSNPKLWGKMTVNFQIKPDGLVALAKGTGFTNPKVTACVEKTIKSMQFPKPRGGGLVNVSYPFTFKPAP
jgi:hypothetical protein